MVLALGDQWEPKVKARQSGGRPGRVNAGAEATAAEPGLKPADPAPAVGAIAPNRSELNRWPPERAARSRGKTRRLAGAEAAAEGRARRA